MAPFNKVYQQALYYDIALRRDVSPEVDFIQAVFQHYNGRPLTSVLEIACGPGYHTRLFARRGIQAVGLDLRPEMLEFASSEARAENATAHWLAADMRSFSLEAPVDMAFCIFDGLDALLSNGDIIQHFRAIAANLTPGGLYLIEQTHPRFSSFQNYGAFQYAGERNGLAVEIVWATNNPTIDPITGIAEVNIEMHIHENGHHHVIHDSAQERSLLPQEMYLLAERSEALQVVGWYGDFKLNQPLTNSPTSQKMITILQKLGGA